MTENEYRTVSSIVGFPGLVQEFFSEGFANVDICCNDAICRDLFVVFKIGDYEFNSSLGDANE